MQHYRLILKWLAQENSYRKCDICYCSGIKGENFLINSQSFTKKERISSNALPQI